MADVINWAWQGTLLVVVVSGYSRLSRRIAAAARYRLWWAALLTIIALPAAAGWLQSTPAAAITSAEIVPVVELPANASLIVPAFGALWAAWIVVALTRIAVALIALRRMKRMCLPFPEEREARLAYWSSMRAGGRRARLVLSPVVGSAAVLGGFHPMIAVSPALLRHLDDQDLDQIVLHEWAHVQRWDDIGQLAQQLTAAVLGLHPAVWWAGRELQLERELACDERVAQTTGSAKRYAACLLRLAAVVALPKVPAMIPALGPSQLTTRIRRLARQPQGWTGRRSTAWAGAASALLVGTVCAGVAVPLFSDRVTQGETAMSSPRIQADSGYDGEIAEISRGGSMMAAIADPRGIRRVSQRISSALPPAEVPAMPRDTAMPSFFGESIDPRLVPPADGSNEIPGANDLLNMRLLSETVSLPRLPGQELPITTPWLSETGTPSTTPWSAAADAGVAIGRGSTRAARATAGFFTRMSKSIAGGI